MSISLECCAGLHVVLQTSSLVTGLSSCSRRASCVSQFLLPRAVAQRRGRLVSSSRADGERLSFSPGPGSKKNERNEQNYTPEESVLPPPPPSTPSPTVLQYEGSLMDLFVDPSTPQDTPNGAAAENERDEEPSESLIGELGQEGEEAGDSWHFEMGTGEAAESFGAADAEYDEEEGDVVWETPGRPAAAPSKRQQGEADLARAVSQLLGPGPAESPAAAAGRLGTDGRSRQVAPPLEAPPQGGLLGLFGPPPGEGLDAAPWDEEDADVDWEKVSSSESQLAGSQPGEEAGVSDAGFKGSESRSGRPRWPQEEGDREEDYNRRFKLRNGKEILEERTYLVGIEQKSGGHRSFTIRESLAELAELASTAGLAVVGSTYQRLANPSPRTYIGAGKVAELKAAVLAYGVETVIFDDELSPGQLRNLEKELGEEVRVCDRTALILDIFSQRAATKEATLQVVLAQTEYQLPRLTRMWSHLERQAGGDQAVKGMGEKQIEVDKRILRTRLSVLKKELETVREHRQQYRDRRAATPIPVISLVGYTNAGKSTLMNRLCGASLLAEDKLFATLDPTTRRVELPNGKESLFTDTVGFIQKLPTQLVAAFRATLEEISDASLLVHVVDISHPMAEQQSEAVRRVLDELDVAHIPLLTVWNKVDKAADPDRLRQVAARRGGTVCISGLTGEGMPEFYSSVEKMIKDLMVSVKAVVPYAEGELLNIIHKLGVVEHLEHLPNGTLIQAYVPLSLSRQLLPYRNVATETGVV